MIAVAKPEPVSSARSHEKFLELLPSMRAQARFAFRNLAPHERAEAIEEVLALAFGMYVSLLRRNREHLAFPTPLVRYAIRRYRIGRRLGTRSSVNDVMSPHARLPPGVRLLRKPFQVDQLLGAVEDCCGLPPL